MTAKLPIARWLLYGLLVAPAVAIGYRVLGGADAADMLHPTGEMSVRLMMIALMIGPALRLWPKSTWLKRGLRHRRHIGVAAFGYAVAHLIFYLIETQTLKFLLDEIGAPGIWTGWLAFFLMLVPALASNDASMRAMKRLWKPVQRLLYAAVIFTVLHWGLLVYEWTPAIVHVAPWLALQIAVFFIFSLSHNIRMTT